MNNKARNYQTQKRQQVIENQEEKQLQERNELKETVMLIAWFAMLMIYVLFRG